MAIPYLTAFNSFKFRFWTFISMILLIMVHTYNLRITYLRPWTLPEEQLSFNTFFQYLISNGMTRFFVPMLFIISGYLWAMKEERPYLKRIKTRAVNLFLPYIIWSAFGLLLTYILELFPYTRQVLIQTHFLQVDSQRLLLHQYRWYEWIFRWIIVPIPYQLWFIRVLLFYNVIYPAIKYCVLHQRIRPIYFGVAFILWMASAGFLVFDGEGLLFFSIGIWIQKTDFNIEKPVKWLQPGPWSIVFIFVALLKTWLAFKGQPLLGNATYIVLLVLYKLVVFSGLVTAWYGCDAFVQFCAKRAWVTRITSFSFITYALHTPILFYLNASLLPLLKDVPDYRLMLYLLVPVFILIFCIATGAFLRRAVPKVYAILTGGRGM